MDTYCNFCGKESKMLFSTHDQKSICWDCSEVLGLCEVCGSIRKEGQLPDNQPHYEEECFK